MFTSFKARPEPKVQPKKYSRNGCPQCKKKKIKCDETLPSCLNCSRTRCGYLDYSSKEIEKIKLSHWEQEGSTSLTNPIKGQLYDPNKSIDIIHIAPKPAKSKSSPINNSANILKYSTIIKDKEFISLVKHKKSEPILNFTKYPLYFNETYDSFVLRHVLATVSYFQIISSYKEEMMFNALLLIGTGSFLKKHSNDLQNIYLNIRADSVKVLLKNLGNGTVDDTNAISLLSLAINLDITSVFLNDQQVNYQNYFKLLTGPLSILEKVYENPLDFPKSFSSLKYYADGMLNTVKCVWIPQYDFRVLFEFKDVVEDFGSKYISSILKNTDDFIIKEQFNDLIEILEFCIELFSNHRSDELVVRYPIDKLYQLYQKWFTLYPSECIILDNSRMSNVGKVFYVFWFALFELLEAIIINCRYIFSFFLDGYYTTYPFNFKKVMDSLKDDEDLKWYFNYCGRIIAFTDRRMCYVMSNTILNEPIPHFLNLKDRLKARPLDIHEKCIIKFKDTVIKEINYPSETTKPQAGVEGGSQDRGTNYYNINNDPKDINLNIVSLDSKREDIDLRNNINPDTCLLNNDYDPRFTNPLFTRPFMFQECNLEFLRRALEDRARVIKMTEEQEEDSETEPPTKQELDPLEFEELFVDVD